ncbi:alpha/beta hydrolase [Lutibacter sp. TH_r2]|uniref:alpha/beta fold hydrolase n=1 Tax=Lutibacter sp. TH_r2 TaxID=3082083 RepID=UPI00295555F0|nr:alpha/beta hydrolase [Lutibacter sp. TH_r2]MDV7187339.1 alpha/beta hydrolase [Lutibacter sp. TH_r2]
MSTPKTDEKINESFKAENTEVFISTKKFEGFTYRVLALQKKNDSTLPTVVFIHGSIGSAINFKKYLTDKDLNKKANLIAYDRVGYGVFQTGDVQESIEFEKNLLEDLIKNIPSEKIILVGYSYGGPIALASNKTYKKVILLAPAVYSKVEPMPWALNFYKWKLTQWLVPEVWKAASKEKISHPKDLKNFENKWNLNVNEIISFHGDKDWIVPYDNSVYLKKQYINGNYKLITLPNAGHGLVWTRFKEIKTTLLQQLN